MFHQKRSISYVSGEIRPPTAKWSRSKLEGFAKSIGYSGGVYEFALRHTHCYVGRQFEGEGRDLGFMGAYACRPRDIRICIACVKQDWAAYGFTYWRRGHQRENVLVCSAHNVNLITRCPGCAAAYGVSQEKMDVLWNGCSCGVSLRDCAPDKNADPLQLKYAKFLQDLSEYEGAYSLNDVDEVVWQRLYDLCFLKDISRQFAISNYCQNSVLDWMRPGLKKLMKEMMYRRRVGGRVGSSVQGYYRMMFSLFDDFRGFVVSAEQAGVVVKNLRDVWKDSAETEGLKLIQY